ncbi:hypothetical protein PENTCL1PPCAC_938, partial [Pristionchus entomophagus]
INIIQMTLIEWDTSDKLKLLLQLLQNEDAMGGIPNNHVTDAAIRLSLENSFRLFGMRYLSTDHTLTTAPTYVFVVEKTRKAVNCYARAATREHDAILLKNALGELVDRVFDWISTEGGVLHETLFIHSDSFTDSMLSEEVVASRGFAVSSIFSTEHFYMTNEMMKMMEQTVIPPIDGFHVDSVDLERDLMRIQDNWESSPTLEDTKAYLRHLPSVVVRSSSSGEAVAWGMLTPFGTVSNLFTMPKFRGKAVAKLAGDSLCQCFIRQGLRPFAFVGIGNSSMHTAMKRGPWPRWNDENGDAFLMHVSSIRKIVKPEQIGKTSFTIHPRANL